ncbi:MAG: hypothetical protein A3H28_07585 [Acidobacteria bacterium RIFCSPLOWO2_02_FULL_61_28]|nr:MAG: hypothetical protein A3H28_07585 [Acidobacteria bacterium RIFCSPLOWO2_02_FULL_61_28]
MKSINLFAGVLFVLVGFCAGVAFNFIPITTAAQGPPEPPPAALKSVAHDATLKGDGTPALPLGIANGGVGTVQLANGAVTAPKLSAAPGPSAGQVLGFNGANLAWQNVPVGIGRIVDSRGQVVGPFFGFSGVIRQMAGFTFGLGISPTGFGSGNVNFYHTTSDCSETRFLADGGNSFTKGGAVIDGILFYAIEPLQQITANSFEQILPGDNPNQPGRCFRLNPTPTLVGLVATFDLSTLGLVPPFHLEF